MTRGTSHGQIFQTIPEDFSLFVRLWASKTEEDAAQSCPMGLSGETVGSDLLKPDSVKSRLWWLKNKVCEKLTKAVAATRLEVRFSEESKS